MESAAAETAGAPGDFGIYVHVPFCATRCGYCDFNTYLPAKVGATPGGANNPMDAYYAAAATEIRQARATVGTRTVQTIFFGGGTPTLLPPAQLAGLLEAIATAFPLDSAVEITTEANPESVDAASLRQLRAAGFNRLSLGMQSARPHVLAELDRQHTPGRVAAAVAEARAAGFEHVNLDLIYGAATETDDDWRTSLQAVIDAGVDHVSAYALIVEDGTALGRRVARGEVAAPDDDVLADRYLLADAMLGAAGFSWYEVSNWALTPSARCRHNELYWRGADWWGIGPGAHSHLAGERWWNVKHPTRYAALLETGEPPRADSEVLSAAARRLEEIMLRLRTIDGLPFARLSDAGRFAATRAAADGLLEAPALAAGHAVLTLRGRLLADAVIRDVSD